MIKRIFILLGLVSLVGFASAQPYTLDISGTTNGSVILVPPGGSYAADEVVTLTPDASNGYTFSFWSGNLTGSTVPETITMDGDKSVTANYTQDQYTLTINQVGSGGSLSHTPVQSTYLWGETVNLSATVDAGWTFEGWTGDIITTSSSTSIVMNGNKSVTGTFTQDQYILTITSAHGTVIKSPDQSTYTYGESVGLEAQAVDGWTFSGWSGDLSGSTNPTSITMNDDRSVTANYTQDQYTLTITSAHGTVIKSPDQGTYVYGDVVDLTLVVDPGWTFDNWSGDLTGGTTPTSITMNGDKTITATFTEDTYTLTINTTGDGSVTHDPVKATYVYGDVVDLEAFADPGWTFMLWSGDASGSTNPTSVTMNGSKIVTAIFNQDQYTLTINRVGNGSVTPVPDQATYVFGDIVSLNALADPGWTFSGWSGDASGVVNPGSVTMNGNRSVTATFTQDQYTLTINTVGNGSVTPSPNQTTYVYGDNVSLNALADPGWTFSVWSGDASGVVNPGSVTMNGNRTVTATFTEDTYTLTINTVGNGSVTPTPDQATYLYGDIVSLNASADPGWTFSGWSGDASGGTNPTSVTMNANTSVTATFTQDQYTLTINTVGNGSVTPAPNQATYTYGQVVNLEVTADPGWTFAGWSGDATGTSNPTPVTMNGSRSVTATFTQDQYTLTINTVGNGSVSPAPNQATYVYGDIVSLNALADPGWTFSAWSGDASGGINPGSVTMNGNRSVTATFTQDQYTLSINTSGDGSVTRSPNQATYIYGDVVNIEAFADPGWTFSNWLGDASGSSNPTSVTMNGNRSVTAIFTQDQYTLTINSVGDGSVTPVPNQVSYVYGDVVNLSAVANPGWTFASWSGDASGVSTTTSVTMNGNKTVTANFSQNSYTLKINIVGNGAVTPFPDQSTYVYGDVVSLIAISDPGWTFAGWSGDLGGTDQFTSIDIDGNKTITATFTQDTYTLTINRVGNGSVTPSPNQSTYLYGDVVNLTALADPGWTFSGWSGDASGGTNPTSITMNGNRTVTATFTQDNYSLTINTVGNGSVTRSPNQATYVYGDDVNLTALADEGWTFTGWLGDASGGANPTTVIMNGNRSVTATFVQDIYPLTINVVGSGSVTRSPNQASYLSGSVVNLTAFAVPGWTFGSWSGDLSGTSITASITMDGPMTITATFIQDIYTLSIDIVGDGSVTRSPNQGAFLSGSVVNLEAIADPGRTFTNWSGDLGGTSTTASITMDSHKSITASFQLNTYQVYLQTVPSGASAAIFTPSSPVTVSHGIAQSISVENPSGYRFLEWTTTSPNVSIDNPNTALTSIIASSGPSNVYANFERVHNLTVTASVAEAILSPSGTVVVVEGVPQSIAVNEPVGYRFLNWTVIGGSANIDDPGLQSTEVTLNSEDATVRANFERIYTLTLESDLAQAVFDPPSPMIVAHGTAQLISVTVPEGYDFVNWTVTSGSAYIVNPDSPATSVLLTTDDVTIRANFELKEYQLVLIAESVTEAVFTPPSPITVQHGVSQTISVSAREGFSFDGWLVETGVVDIVNPGLATTSVTLTAGDATLEASFEKVVEVNDISIPNATMKIGDIISATITVSNDAGFPYSLVSGLIGGYPLTGLQRVDETTYLANFVITEGGNSYLANENIPVSNLVISDGTIQSVPYAGAIIQNNDLLDANLPVIFEMTVASGIMKVGDVVSLNIRTDGLRYSLLPTSSVNGISVSESNMEFRELTGGNYLLTYMVREGDRDVGAGEFLASIILVKPSGNIGLPYFQVSNSANLTIDAHSPLVSQVEVSPGEFGVDGTVRIAVTADGVGYMAVSGTVINGIALSSAQISFSERSGGLYELSYTVKKGDSDVSPGDLQIQIVLADPAGNNSVPVTSVESNEVEVYTILPTAVLAGTTEVCEWENAALTVFLNGRGPWEFDLYNGDSTVTYRDVESSPYSFDVTPLQTTSYLISLVRDRNGVVNSGSRIAEVTVNENTFLEFINLLSGYSVDSEPVKLEANVAGGVFSGPGVISATGYFNPGIAGTVDSPHILQYTYTNSKGCTSVASALVFVLGAEGDIFIPSEFVCTNGESFTVNASNTSGVDGSFRLLNSNSQAVDAIIDHGDNTAEIDPSLMSAGSYTIEYRYVDETPFFLRKEFLVESVVIPEILNLQDTVYCQNSDPILLKANVEGVVFEGPGIVHTLEGYLFDPAEAEPGERYILCTNQSENGCLESVMYKLHILAAPAALFELTTSCIPADGGVVSFINMTNDKLNVDSWEWNFDDPSSGEGNVSSDIEPSHMYLGMGRRRISLTATSIDGCVDSYVRDTLIGIHPVADFSMVSGCYRDESGVEFLNRSAFGGVAADSLVWTFMTHQGIVLERRLSTSATETIEYSFASEGSYKVDLYAYSAGGCSDSTSKEIDLLTTVRLDKTGYVESFDGQDLLWTAGSESGLNSWTLNEPDFTDFEPVIGDKAWFTQLPADVINYNEESWIHSPCFDFTGIDRPMIQMDIMRSFIPNTNGAVLQYMDVVEEGWKTVGSKNPGIGWYNVLDLANKPGGSKIGWGLNVFNPDKEWVRAAHDLDEVAGKSGVKFRIVLTSTGAQGIGNQGFALNDLLISERSKVSILEYFTNSSIESSKSADDLIDSLAETYSRDVINLQYHMEYPGFDPMGENNPVPATTRSFYYGIPDVPYAVLDGGVSEMFHYGFTDLKTTPILDYIGLGALDQPKFKVDLEVDWKKDSLYTTAKVTCITNQYSEYLLLYLVVFETSVSAYTGLNGDQEFRNVVLDMLPTPGGKLLKGDWENGDTMVRVNEWEYQPYIEDIIDLGVAAFVQDRKTGQILQATAIYKDIRVDIVEPHILSDMHLYPNPARNVVYINLGSTTEEEAVIRLLDMNGRVVRNEKMSAGHQIYELNIHDLVQGMYVLQWIESGQIRGIEKIVKTR